MIKLIKSTFYQEEETKKKLSQFILDESIFSMGNQCRNFEKAFANKQGCKHAVFVSNGSVANLLLIQSLLSQGLLSRGDKVGFSALTWPTNVMPLIQLGLEPVALDCELDTLNVSPEKLSEKIGELKGLFLTNVLGFADDIVKIKEMCDENGVLLIEDNCESLGSKVDGKLLGNYGLASTFSFFVGHHMSTIEGGMVCTDDDELHDQLVVGRAHGWDRNLTQESQQKLRKKANVDDFYAKYTFYELASNFRPTEINGFIGNTQIEFWDAIVNARLQNFSEFSDAISRNDDIFNFDLSHMDIVSNFAMPIVCKSKELADEYKQLFADSSVEIRPVIAGNMARQPFFTKYVDGQNSSPNADLIHSQGFYFGNNPDMTGDEIELLCKLLKRD